MPDVADVQRELLDADTALLEYAIGEQRSYLWVICRQSVRAFPLPGRPTLDRHVRAIARLMNPGGVGARMAHLNAEYRHAAQALASALIRPALTNLAAKRLLIVPDGSLHYVPFAALPLAGGAPLIEKYEVVLLPSSATALSLRRRRTSPVPPQRRLAIIADPVYDAQDARVTQANVSARIQTGDPAGTKLCRLPFSRREALAIRNLLPRSNCRVLLGFDASKQMLTQGKLRDYDVLHISTHGLADTVRPERSELVFSLVNRNGRPQAGDLRLDELYNLNLKAELVVLSACQTAIGREVRGEGLLSLTRGFLYAGAARVVASLWRVDDEATAELMRSFYQKLLRDRNCTPAAALRFAQLEIGRQERWKSPFYWAGLVLEGEP